MPRVIERKGSPAPIDKATIGSPILPSTPPRVMFEGDWPGRIIDGIDRTFPTDYLMPERRMSLFQVMKASRAFRSENAVPTITPEARARLNSEVAFAPRSSPLRPPLIRGATAPMAPSSEHPPRAALETLGGSHEHPRPVFRNPFAAIHEGTGGEHGIDIQVEGPDGAKVEIPVEFAAAKHVRKPPGSHGPSPLNT